MNLEDIIKLLENRLTYHSQQRDAAFNRGDLKSMQLYDEDIASTQQTLDQIRGLMP